MNHIDKQLKDLNKKQQLLDQQRKRLLSQQKAEEQKKKTLQSLVEESKYSNPSDLISDLIQYLGAKLPKSESIVSKKRTRTKITPEVRDSIKLMINSGKTKMSVSKESQISYVVIGKIAKGEYDHL